MTVGAGGAAGAPGDGSEVRAAWFGEVTPADSGAAPLARLDDLDDRGSEREAGNPAGGAAPLAGLVEIEGGQAPARRTAQLGALRTGARGHGRGAGPPEGAESGAGDQRRGEVPRARSHPGRRRSGGDPAELEPDADPLVVAREICLRLLTDRARTRQELAHTLRRRGVPDDAAGAVLERFDEVGLIDDAAFAGQWVRSRHAHRGLARRAIALELRRKGVADDVAGEALAGVDAGSEERRARELVDRKLRSITVGTTEQNAAAGRRLVGMLARKGYGAAVAYRVVREALAGCGVDAAELGP